MPSGIRNIVVINGLVTLYYFVTYYLLPSEAKQTAMAWAQLLMGTAFLLTGASLLIRHRIIWQVIRIFCYVWALLLAFIFLSAVIEGALWTYPIRLLLLLLLVVYLIGMRGYLNENHVRAHYGVMAQNKPVE